MTRMEKRLTDVYKVYADIDVHRNFKTNYKLYTRKSYVTFALLLPLLKHSKNKQQQNETKNKQNNNNKNGKRHRSNENQPISKRIWLIEIKFIWRIEEKSRSQCLVLSNGGAEFVSRNKNDDSHPPTVYSVCTVMSAEIYYYHYFGFSRFVRETTEE